MNNTKPGFTSLVLKDHEQQLRCNTCSVTFWTDACGEDNLYWDNRSRSLKPECPGCGTQG